MKRAMVGISALLLLLAMAVPAFAAGPSYGSGSAGASTGAGILDRDRLQDGTGVDCPAVESAPIGDQTPDRDRVRDCTPQNAAAPQGQAEQLRVQNQLAAQEASGQAGAANASAMATQKAQTVLAQNEERVETRLKMPETIRTFLSDLLNRISERFHLMFGLS